MKKTRAILLKDTSGNSIEFNINPESITISDSRSNIKENIDALGDVCFPGKRGLRTVSIATFLPERHSRFRRKGSQASELSLLEKWINKDIILRVVISKPTVNFKAILDSKDITVKEGSLDVYVDLKLTEVKDIEVQSVDSISIFKKEENTQNEVKLSDRPAENAPKAGQIEIVNSKTTLYGLAKKYYGKGEDWKKIADANGGVDPKKLKEGMQLLIP